MSAKNKQQKFAELSTFPNTFQNFTPQRPQLINARKEPIDYRGAWNAKFFKRDAPIVLELACGKAEYARFLAEKNPDQNFFGVDVKGNRLWKGAKYALEHGMTNIGFLRTPIEQLPHFFDKDEVAALWITFPDPYPRKAKARKRLTSSRFLSYYRQFTHSDGIVHLKTDADLLFDFTLEVIQEERLPVLRLVRDVYAECPDDELLTHQTFYEKMHLDEGRIIKYVSFRLNP